MLAKGPVLTDGEQLQSGTADVAASSLCRSSARTSAPRATCASAAHRTRSLDILEKLALHKHFQLRVCRSLSTASSVPTTPRPVKNPLIHQLSSRDGTTDRLFASSGDFVTNVGTRPVSFTKFEGLVCPWGCRVAGEGGAVTAYSGLMDRPAVAVPGARPCVNPSRNRETLSIFLKRI
jgi:hypothetical protein